ncbi:MAG: tandem-95 repeat protein, partial [Acidimicrobiia bacterium]|nr:tandem-95 repeat protein [Acidimicrobiia bacterium]
TEDALFTYTVPAGAFADVDAGDSLALTTSALPAWLAFDPATRTFSGTPRNGDVGFVDIAVTATDGGGASASDTFRLAVGNTNDVPSAAAAAESASGNEDTVVTGTLLAGSDPDGDALIYSLVPGSAQNGAVAINASTRAFTFTPAANATGAASFQYTVNDGQATSAGKTVSLTLTPVNDAPTLDDPADRTILEDAGPQNVALAGIGPGGGSDETGQGVALTATSSNQALIADGGLTLSGAGASRTLGFTPSANASGVATITLTAQDSGGTANGGQNTRTQSFVVTVTAVDDLPVAVGDAASVAEDASVSGSVAGNDTPSGDGGNVYALAGQAVNGVAVVTAAGGFTYAPNPNFNGADSFSYSLTDADGSVSTATVALTVTAADDLPVAVADAASVPEDGFVYASLTGNDTPSGDGGNVYALQTGAANGTASVNVIGEFSYLPNPDFSGSDSFTYILTDANGSASTATVAVTVAPVNDAPVAVADTALAAEDGGAVVIAPAALLANDTDADAGDTRRIVAVAATGLGAVSLNPAGDVVYDPLANFQALAAGESASDTFTYTVEDSAGAQASATVTVTVAGVNEPAPPPPPPPPPAPSGSTDGDDDLRFGGAVDIVDALGGNDTIRGGGGNDRIDGGDGRNRYFGGAGNDVIDAANGSRERIDCGSGNDTVRADLTDRVSG